MGIEDAGEAQLHNLFDASRSSAVQVALVLAKLDKEAVVNVPLHLGSIDKMIVHPVHLSVARRTRGICQKKYF